MNRLESLPEELVEHIFRFEHSLKFQKSLSAILSPNRRNPDFDTHIWSVFFASNMTKQDIRDWYLLTRWTEIVIDHQCHPRILEGLEPDFVEEMLKSKYVILYKHILQMKYI